MGRFRKFLPYTAFGDGRRVARDRGHPAALGLLVEGRDHRRARSSPTTTASGSSARSPRSFTGVYMTRLIFLTFYGNERFGEPLSRGAAGGLGRLRRRRRGRRRRPTDADADADERPRLAPTVAYGEPVRTAPHGRTRRTSRPIDHGRSRSLVLAVLAAVGRLPQPAVRRPRLPRPTGSSRCSAGVDDAAPVVVRRRARARGARGRVRARRPRASRYLLYRRGLRVAGRRPARREARRGRARCSGNAYYYDDGHRRLVGGPGARVRRRSSTGSSTRRSSTARSTASATLVGALGERPAPRRRTASSGATRSASRSAPSRSCSTSSLWAGR